MKVSQWLPVEKQEVVRDVPRLSCLQTKINSLLVSLSSSIFLSDFVPFPNPNILTYFHLLPASTIHSSRLSSSCLSFSPLLFSHQLPFLFSFPLSSFLSFFPYKGCSISTNFNIGKKIRKKIINLHADVPSCLSITCWRQSDWLLL